MDFCNLLLYILLLYCAISIDSYTPINKSCTFVTLVLLINAIICNRMLSIVLYLMVSKDFPQAVCYGHLQCYFLMYNPVLAVADIPGLVSGAHQNYGLGFSFLRHIERCSCLLYVIDLAEDEPWRQLELLQYELDQYRPGLSTRPAAIIANKADLHLASQNLETFTEKVTSLPVIPISAREHIGIDDLLVQLRAMYDKHVKQEESG